MVGLSLTKNSLTLPIVRPAPTDDKPWDYSRSDEGHDIDQGRSDMLHSFFSNDLKLISYEGLPALEISHNHTSLNDTSLTYRVILKRKS